MIAKLELTQSNAQQNKEQLQNPTMGVTIKVGEQKMRPCSFMFFFFYANLLRGRMVSFRVQKVTMAVNSNKLDRLYRQIEKLQRQNMI